MRLPQDRILHIDIKYVENQVKVTAEWQGELVQCKDCKNWQEWENGTGSCHKNDYYWFGTDATDFCSFAERREP